MQPDEVYNLAAQSHVRVSFEQPVYSVQVDALGTMNLLESIRDCCNTTGKLMKFYQASSSEMYGKVVETPQTETTPFYPRSPYACAKVFSFWQTVNYRESYGLFAVQRHSVQPRVRRGEARRSSPARSPAPPRASRKGLQKKLFLGNLDAKRDWGHARDYVEAMWLMLQHHTPDDYVVATGETHAVREFLDEVFGHLGFGLGAVRRERPALPPPGRGGFAAGGPGQGQAAIGLEAARDVQGVGPTDDRVGLGTGPPRAPVGRPAGHAGAAGRSGERSGGVSRTVVRG